MLILFEFIIGDENRIYFDIFHQYMMKNVIQNIECSYSAIGQRAVIRLCLNFFFILNSIFVFVNQMNKDLLAEWLKAVDSSSVIFRCVGSNPVIRLCPNFFFFFFIIILNFYFYESNEQVLVAQWIRRKTTNLEIVGSSPVKDFLCKCCMVLW